MPTPQLSAAPYSCLLCWSTNVSTKAWWSHSGIICWRNCPVDASAPEAGRLRMYRRTARRHTSSVKRMHIRMRSKPTAEELPSFCPFPMWNWKGASQPIYFQLFSGRATDFQTTFLCGETFIFNFGVPKINLRISGVFVWSLKFFSLHPHSFWEFVPTLQLRVVPQNCAPITYSHLSCFRWYIFLKERPRTPILQIVPGGVNLVALRTWTLLRVWACVHAKKGNRSWFDNPSRAPNQPHAKIQLMKHGWNSLVLMSWSTSKACPLSNHPPPPEELMHLPVSL